MQTKRYFLAGMAVLISSSLLVSGCALNFYKQSPRSKKKIKDLESTIGDLKAKREKERAQFEATKRMLEQKLRSQIADKSVSLKMDDRGLVIILSDDILFDSGKAEVKRDAFPILDKVAGIIKKQVPDKNIGISGHTDNVPIKHSGWESNWELSTTRATNVLHYLESRGVSPKRLSATGYGEHRAIASNATAEGRAQNRRVEIVILPQFVEKRGKGADRDIK
ncbi:MAG: OmpA family protein [Candidatus Omnitrophota bacterium]|nr:OmpA family protein [Candidatus Omnitrophota bacterium]